MIRKILIATMLAGTFGTIAIPAAAQSGLRNGPPPPRNESTPEPRRNRHWVPGHWQWRTDNRRYHWVAGTWIRDRPGYRYNQPTWTERDGRWHMTRGNWARGDRDGDGVPNRRDSHPNNPNRS